MTDAKPYVFGISHSKLASFRRCKQRYQWNYVDKFYPRSSIGQARGTAGHTALANWHVNYDAQLAMQAAFDQWFGEGYQYNDDWKMLEDALNRYFQWSAANDTFKILESEFKFEIEYLIRTVPSYEDMPPEGFPVKFVGYIDGIVQDNGQLWLLENKFHKRVDTSGLDMDMQATLYMLAANLLQKPVAGVIYNIVRVGDTKVALTEPVVRRILHRNSEGLDRVQSEVLAQAEEMIHYERQGGKPYRNPTKDCSWDCSFYSACMSMLDNGIESREQLASVCHIRKEEDENA